MSTLSETPEAGPSKSSSSSSTTALLYTPEKSVSPPATIDPVPARELSKYRLYVGNLHPSVDEYAFLQVFKKFGTIAKLDFLFHKSGPSKGKPRGYAFVEYKDKEDALKALVNAHDKLLRGRKLVVTYANQAPTYEGAPYSASGKRRTEPHRPTALSLIKSSSHPGKTEDKIAVLEAKLRQMDKQNTTSTSSLPSHPSLPLKPPPPTTQPAFPDAGKTFLPQPLGQSKKPAGIKVGGIFASGLSSSLGKKPTLEELMKAKKKTSSQGGLLRQ